MSAETNKSASCKMVICPLLLRLLRLMSATPKTIITEPIICQTPAVSLNKTIPKINDRTAEMMLVTVTIDRSAVFKTFKTINQLNDSKKPFSAKIKTNFAGIFIPNGSHIRLSKNETVVNKTKIVDSLLFLTAHFLKIL